MHSWFVNSADFYGYIKKSNLISLQKMFLHLAKREYNSPVLAELFQDTVEWHNKIVREYN